MNTDFYGIFTEDGLDQVTTDHDEAMKEARNLRAMGYKVTLLVRPVEGQLYEIAAIQRDENVSASVAGRRYIKRAISAGKALI